MTPSEPWLLRTTNTVYAVTLAPGEGWAELSAWGPHGAEQGPSPLDWSRRTHFITPADASPAEYIPYGPRPFTGADLVAQRPGEERGVWWRFTGASADGGRAASRLHRRHARTDHDPLLRDRARHRRDPALDRTHLHR